MGFLMWLAGILFVLWLFGLVFKVAGGIIHLLLIAAVILFIINFFRGRGRA